MRYTKHVVSGKTLIPQIKDIAGIFYFSLPPSYFLKRKKRMLIPPSIRFPLSGPIHQPLTQPDDRDMQREKRRQGQKPRPVVHPFPPFPVLVKAHGL